MATFSSFLGNYGYTSGTGKTHRHLLDKITLAVQSETPFMDGISRAKMNTPNIEWLEESLTTGNHTDVVKYGETLTGLSDNHKSAPTITQRSGYAQQFAKGITVTDEQMNAAKASVKSSNEMAEETYTKTIEMKTDVEASLLQNGAGSAGATRGSGNTTGAVTTAATLTGAFSQIASGNVLYNNATAGTGTATSTDSIIAAADFYNEEATTAKRDAVRLIDRIAVTLYQNGGLSYKGGNGFVKDANMVLLTPNNKFDFDLSLDSRSNVRRDLGAMGTMLGMMFTTYTSSYGTFKVLPDRFLPGGTASTSVTGTVANQAKALVFNPQNWALAVNQDFKSVDIARVGLAENKMLSARFGLIHRNQNVSGAIEDINPAISS